MLTDCLLVSKFFVLFVQQAHPLLSGVSLSILMGSWKSLYTKMENTKLFVKKKHHPSPEILIKPHPNKKKKTYILTLTSCCKAFLAMVWKACSTLMASLAEVSKYLMCMSKLKKKKRDAMRGYPVGLKETNGTSDNATYGMLPLDWHQAMARFCDTYHRETKKGVTTDLQRA